MYYLPIINIYKRYAGKRALSILDIIILLQLNNCQNNTGNVELSDPDDVCPSLSSHGVRKTRGEHHMFGVG